MQVIVLLKRIFCIIFSIAFCFCPIKAFAGDVSASSAIAIDCASSKVLYEKNAYDRRAMASTTKIMTCLIACESNKLDDVVEISTQMLDGTYGSLIYLKAGDRITLFDLIKGAMLASGNDAANAIAVYLCGSISKFADLMNQYAGEIGMTRSHFVSPSGLDSTEHYSCAYDMALLARRAMDNPLFCDICSLQSCDISINEQKQTIYNHNKLLSDKNCIGIKTGFTDNAGRCLVSSYEYKGNIIIIVTLNAPNDWDDHRYIFKSVQSLYHQVGALKDIIIPVVGGRNDCVKCSVNCKIYSVENVDIRIFYYPFCYAPLKCGDSVGYARIYINDEIIKTVEITVLEDVELWQITK